MQLLQYLRYLGLWDVELHQPSDFFIDGRSLKRIQDAFLDPVDLLNIPLRSILSILNLFSHDGYVVVLCLELLITLLEFLVNYFL